MHPDRFAALTRSLGDSTSRRGLLRLFGVGMAGSAITVVGLNEVEAARKKVRKARKRKARAQATAASLIVPISGIVAGVSRFVGQFELTRFAVQGGQLVAIGTLTGTLTNLVTGAVQQVNQQITLPVANISGTCKILHLELGPLDLELLGLKVHLDKVVLDITAQSGPGNLLGNLLCAIAHLLDDPGGSLNRLVDLLNRLLRLLG